jgi:hypothetical protein
MRRAAGAICLVSVAVSYLSAVHADTRLHSAFGQRIE